MDYLSGLVKPLGVPSTGPWPPLVLPSDTQGGNSDIDSAFPQMEQPIAVPMPQAVGPIPGQEFHDKVMKSTQEGAKASLDSTFESPSAFSDMTGTESMRYVPGAGQGPIAFAGLDQLNVSNANGENEVGAVREIVQGVLDKSMGNDKAESNVDVSKGSAREEHSESESESGSESGSESEGEDEGETNGETEPATKSELNPEPDPATLPIPQVEVINAAESGDAEAISALESSDVISTKGEVDVERAPNVQVSNNDEESDSEDGGYSSDAYEESTQGGGDSSAAPTMTPVDSDDPTVDSPSSSRNVDASTYSHVDVPTSETLLYADDEE